MAVTPFKSSDNFNMAGFNEKIAEADNTYVAKTGGGMTGSLNMGGNKITGLATPILNTDAANKGYVDENTPILMFEDNFENVNGTQLSVLPVGFDCSAFIDTNRKTMVAEGVVTKVSKAINTSSSYYDELRTAIEKHSVQITSFDRGQTLKNIVDKNRNIFSSNCNISTNSVQGKPIESIGFGFLKLDTSYKVQTSIPFTLEMSHGTTTGTSGYFRVWLI